MGKIINWIINWFKYHWQKPAFKIFILFALGDLYLNIFHHREFVQFIQVVILIDLQDFIHNLVHNDSFVTAFGVIVIGILGALFKKHDNDK